MATGKGGHSFAPSLAQHNHNVSLYRGRCARRSGPSMAKLRIDLLLVQRGLCATRAKAQARIMAGEVLVEDRPVTKAGARPWTTRPTSACGGTRCLS